jgi:uncharacterized protein (DUF486 family)
MGFKNYFPNWLHSNNVFYNILSLVRFACFAIFFMRLPQKSFGLLKKALPIISVLFILINFSLYENFFFPNPDRLSGNLLAVEAYLLLVYCMQYYLAELRADHETIFNGQDFWVVTGLSIYVVTNFFVFLFYGPMVDINRKFSVKIWNVHNLSFIIFCLFITKALYGPFRNKHTV